MVNLDLFECHLVMLQRLKWSMSCACSVAFLGEKMPVMLELDGESEPRKSSRIVLHFDSM